MGQLGFHWTDIRVIWLVLFSEICQSHSSFMKIGRKSGACHEDQPALHVSYNSTFKIKGKVHPITGHESPHGEQMYSSTRPSTLALDGGWSAPHPGRFTPGKDPVSLVQKAGWAPGPVWTGAENLSPTGIRSPDRAARSESLYRLSYPGLNSTFTLVNTRNTVDDLNMALLRIDEGCMPEN